MASGKDEKSSTTGSSDIGATMGKLFQPFTKGIKSSSKTSETSKKEKASTKTTIQKKESDDKFDQVLDKFGDSVANQWDRICDRIEESDGTPSQVKWISKNIFRRLSIEAPVVVVFVFVCIFLHTLNITIAPGISVFLGIPGRRFSLVSPLQYVRLVTHVFGHDDLTHLRGNMINMLLVGPSAEAFFGSKEIFQVMCLVALSTALAHVILGRYNSSQLGASGVVFSLILLNSLVSAKRGKIPMSFLLTAILWIGEELWRVLMLLFDSSDRSSHHAHLVGAIVGTVAGYYMILKKETSEGGNGSKTKTS